MLSTKRLIFLAFLLLALFTGCALSEDGTPCDTLEEYVARLAEISLTKPLLTNMSFQVTCTEELYGRLTKDMDYLHELERKAGLVDAHYGAWIKPIMDYKNSKFGDWLPMISSLHDFDEMLECLGDSVPETLYFYIDPELRDTITEKSTRERVYYGCTPVSLGPWYTGMFGTSNCRVTYSDGMLLLHAARTYTRSELKDQDLIDTYDIAQIIVQSLRGRTDREKALELHDILCDKVRYGKALGGAKHPGAVSALKYGQAVCFGYADAYCLLCGMAGIPCVYQAGWTSGGPTLAWDPEKGTRGSHAWNLVRVEGRWQMVDVTWDDRENERPGHEYFLISKEEARRTRSFFENTYTALWE